MTNPCTYFREVPTLIFFIFPLYFVLSPFMSNIVSIKDNVHLECGGGVYVYLMMTLMIYHVHSSIRLSLSFPIILILLIFIFQFLDLIRVQVEKASIVKFLLVLL